MIANIAICIVLITGSICAIINIFTQSAAKLYKQQINKLNDFFQSLKEINSKLWIIEDDKRQCEKDKNFGEKFVKLSRDVHFLNDDRAKIKLEINNHTGSSIKEIKEYTNY